jgi:hypothetical protein
MKHKILGISVHGALAGGMLYAFITLFSLPAFACSTTQCNALQMDLRAICTGRFGANCTNNHLDACNSSEYFITCRTAQGALCGQLYGQCS